MDSYVTGTAIRQLREVKHLTQAELAEKLAEPVPTLLSVKKNNPLRHCLAMPPHPFGGSRQSKRL